jgi:hypothetical protein
VKLFINEKGNGLQLGVTFCELLFSFFGVANLDIGERVPDPFSKFISASLDGSGGAVFRELKDGYRLETFFADMDRETIGPKTWH